MYLWSFLGISCLYQSMRTFWEDVMGIEWLGNFVEKTFEDDYYQNSSGCFEVDYGNKTGYDNKTTHYYNRYFTTIYWSKAIGWSQVLYYSESPKLDTEIRRIDFYSSASDAIADISIFPEHCWVNYFPH